MARVYEGISDLRSGEKDSSEPEIGGNKNKGERLGRKGGGGGAVSYLFRDTLRCGFGGGGGGGGAGITCASEEPQKWSVYQNSPFSKRKDFIHF